jgi:FkbM family methyltransferase
MQFTYKNKKFDIQGLSEDDYIYSVIKDTKCFYEKDLLEYMLYVNSLKKINDSIAIDAGANIGNHSLFMRSFLADSLVAIEPNTAVLPILKQNLSSNINNYTVCECGVGASEAKGNIVISSAAEKNAGMARIELNGNSGEVIVTTIDTIIEKKEKDDENTGHVSIIKIDVEGMELDVLKGAANTIRKYQPHIFVEADSKEEYREVKEFFNGFGYKRVSKWNSTPVYHFAYKPGCSLMIKGFIMQSLHILRRIKARLTR